MRATYALIGHATEPESRNRPSPVGRHHDQIGVPLFGLLEDRPYDLAVAKHRRDLQVRRTDGFLLESEICESSGSGAGLGLVVGEGPRRVVGHEEPELGAASTRERHRRRERRLGKRGAVEGDKDSADHRSTSSSGARPNVALW